MNFNLSTLSGIKRAIEYLYKQVSWLRHNGGGSSGSVQTITGTGVDNTDPTNPVVNTPTWTTLTGKPTTFAPIIGTTATTAKAGNYTPPNVTTTTNGLMLFADKVKLDAAPTAAQVTAKVAKAGDTMTGQLIIGDTVNRSKAILAKHPTGSFSDAPTTFDLSSVYLHLGGVEYANNSYRLIGFGYRRTLDSSHAPAVIGYQETGTATDDKGRLLFATRDVVTDTAATVRLTIETNGEIIAHPGAKFVGDGSGITNLPVAAAVADAAEGTEVETINTLLANLRTAGLLAV